MKKWMTGLLIVVATLVVLALAGLTAGYYKFYKPLLSANTSVAGAKKLERLIAETSAYEPPDTGALTADQVARFVSVMEGVEQRLGSRVATFHAQKEALGGIAGSPTSRAVRGALGEIGGVYLQAKETQYRALNDVKFSKTEYEWVRQQVYAAADLPFARLDLQDLLVDPGDLERLIRIDRPLRDGAAADLNRPLVNDHRARLKDWLALAFFDL
jgi:hypothetical protein